VGSQSGAGTMSAKNSSSAREKISGFGRETTSKGKTSSPSDKNKVANLGRELLRSLKTKKE
jgi:hypothetical protein